MANFGSNVIIKSGREVIMELLLNRNELLDLGKNANGLRIVCVEGLCWVTRSGDHRDQIIRTGDSFVIEGCGHLIINAMSPSRLMLGKTGRQELRFRERMTAVTLKHSAASGV